MAKFEICVTSLQGVKAALEAGADRVELCSGLTCFVMINLVSNC